MTVDDPTSGMVPTPIVERRTEAAQRYADLYSLSADLAYVIRCCDGMRAQHALPEGEQDWDYLQALYTAGLIAYTRCFGGGVRHRLTKDDVKAMPDGANALLVHLHFQDQRDKHLAHAVNPFERVQVGVALSPVGSPQRQVEGVAVFRASLVGMVESDIMNLGRLAYFLLQEVTARAKSAEAEVLAEARTEDLDSLYNQPAMTHTIPGAEHTATNRNTYGVEALKKGSAATD